MIENTNKDGATQHILSNSFMLITNPAFSDIIIHKIKERKRKKAMVYYISFSVLFIIITMIIVVLTIPINQPVTGNIATGLGMSETNILTAGSISGWFSDNFLSLAAIGILFLCKKLADIKLRSVRSSY